MSINWVMIPTTPSPSQPFTPLPSETTLYTSPPRTSFSVSSLGKFPAHQPFSLSSSSGTLYLTTKRLIYLPATPSPTLQSFSSPILNLQDSHVTAPWIGPNVWTALLRPVHGGGLDGNQALEVKITFRDGGAYDFSTGYERVRERLGQAVEVARARGMNVGGRHEGAGGRGGGVEGVEVVMEDLPRYEAARDVGGDAEQSRAEERTERTPEQVFTPPDEPPPGYEQVQREVIEDEFSRRLAGAQLGRDGEEDTPTPSVTR